MFTTHTSAYSQYRKPHTAVYQQPNYRNGLDTASGHTLSALGSKKKEIR